VRASIYAELSPYERSRAHRRAAHALAETGAEGDRVALQLLASEPGGDGWAAEVLRDAGRRAHARGAPDVAAFYFERAVAEPPADGRRAELLVELARAEYAAGDTHGLASLRKALELTPDPRRRAEVSLELARGLAGMLELEQAAKVVEDALADLGDADPELSEQLDAQLLAACVPAPSLLGRVFDRFMSLVRDPSGVSDPLVLALLAGATTAMIEPAAKGAELAERALAGQSPSLEDDPGVITYAFTAIAAAGRLERALGVAEGAHAEARRRGAVPALCMASMLRAHALVRLGRLPAAEADSRYALENMHEDVVLPIPAVVAPLIDVLVERGELAEAEALLERYALEGEIPDLLATGPLLESRARLHMARSRVDEAIADLRECGRRQRTWMVRNPGGIAWRAPLALALAAAGQPKEGLKYAQREVELAREFGVPRALGIALRAAGLIEGGELGIDVLRQAVSVLASTPAELEHARALTDLGAALRRNGERSAAREPLQAAIDLSRRCGALGLAERAHTELVATGARPRRLVFSGVDSLTASERRVAEMAAEGQSNREIAQALFVTEKTVETHLSHAYRKLDISSRSELPAALSAGIPPDTGSSSHVHR
jgi:DNA-binding CsgD family transcriptional regulator